jgi:hypothetical protein
MLFFRSEELVAAWCKANDTPLRPLVSIPQLWGLASAWYATRLSVESRRPVPGEMRDIFERLGLAGDFWDPRSDTFGEAGNIPER